MSVIEEFESRLVAEESSVRLARGSSAAPTLEASVIPEEAALPLANAPEGFRYKFSVVTRIAFPSNSKPALPIVDSKVSVEVLADNHTHHVDIDGCAAKRFPLAASIVFESVRGGEEGKQEQSPKC